MFDYIDFYFLIFDILIQERCRRRDKPFNGVLFSDMIDPKTIYLTGEAAKFHKPGMKFLQVSFFPSISLFWFFDDDLNLYFTYFEAHLNAETSPIFDWHVFSTRLCHSRYRLRCQSLIQYLMVCDTGDILMYSNFQRLLFCTEITKKDKEEETHGSTEEKQIVNQSITNRYSRHWNGKVVFV